MSEKKLYEEVKNCCLQWKQETTEEAAVKLQAKYMFPTEFPGFDGHFPGQPVLPAVIQLAAVRSLVERMSGEAVMPVSYSSTKFKDAVLPGEEVFVQVELIREEASLKGSFLLSKEDQKEISSGKCLFEPFAVEEKRL